MKINKNTLNRFRKPLLIIGMMAPVLSMLYFSSFMNLFYYVHPIVHVMIMILFSLGLVIFYLIPSIVGMQSKHIKSILIINLLLGWTLLGWIGALIWAINSPEIHETSQEPAIHSQKDILSEQQKSNDLNNNSTLIDDLSKLVDLKEKGVLSDDEFRLAKSKLLDVNINN